MCCIMLWRPYQFSSLMALSTTRGTCGVSGYTVLHKLSLTCDLVDGERNIIINKSTYLLSYTFLEKKNKMHSQKLQREKVKSVVFFGLVEHKHRYICTRQFYSCHGREDVGEKENGVKTFASFGTTRHHNVLLGNWYLLHIYWKPSLKQDDVIRFTSAKKKEKLN